MLRPCTKRKAMEGVRESGRETKEGEKDRREGRDARTIILSYLNWKGEEGYHDRHGWPG